MNAQDRKQREAMHGENYVHRFSHGRQHARVARLVDRIVLPPQARVLDAGCARGCWRNCWHRAAPAIRAWIFRRQ